VWLITAWDWFVGLERRTGGLSRQIVGNPTKENDPVKSGNVAAEVGREKKKSKVPD